MKRFISLGAAIMMGTVLSKEHKHGDKKAVAKAEKNHDKGFLITKKESVESIEEPEMIVENKNPQISEATYSNYQSPETSKDSVKNDISPTIDSQDSTSP